MDFAHCREAMARGDSASNGWVRRGSKILMCWPSWVNIEIYSSYSPGTHTRLRT